MRARDRAALYVASNWRVSKRLPRITAYLNSNRQRLEDRCGLCGSVLPHTCQVDLNRQMAENYEAAMAFAERLRSGR